MLTLERLLAAALDAGRPLRLLIETKHPTRFGGDGRGQAGRPCCASTAWTNRSRRRPVHVTVMSFSALAVRRIRELAPGRGRGLAHRVRDTGPPRWPAAVRRQDRRPRRARGPGEPAVVGSLHDNGNRVYVWTVNEPADLDLMLELGVDGIISDRPRSVLDRLGR